MISYLTSLMALVALGSPSSILRGPARIFPMEEASITMDGSERRQLTRYNIRTPLRFRAINLTADKSDHFTEALNVSRGGFYFASSAPLQIGTPIEATLRPHRVWRRYGAPVLWHDNPVPVRIPRVPGCIALPGWEDSGCTTSRRSSLLNFSALSCWSFSVQAPSALIDSSTEPAAWAC